MTESNKHRRVTLKHTRPNPLFQTWLEELYDEAKEKDSKLQPMLKEALDSLSKYPLPLKSGSDCAILKGFGKKLCMFLDQRLDVYTTTSNSISKSSNGSSKTSPVIQSRNCPTSSSVVNDNAVPSASNRPKTRSPKKYKPAFRSGGYAILIALLNHFKENSHKPSLNKTTLMEKAQPFSEESFFRPKPESFYTAWSNMSRLISKGLINKTGGKKAEFSLTTEGIIIANELLKQSEVSPTVNDIIFNNAAPSPMKTSPIKESIELEPDLCQNQPSHLQCSNEIVFEMPAGTFEVVLLIDKQETSGASKKNDPTVAQFNKYPNLKHEYRHLKVGDFTWVAQNKTDKSQEFVLPFIVERKRMDDLGASIKDGRFHEQKFRLRKCGINNVIYLVENYGSNKHVGLPYLSLMQALANTRVQDEFKVHMTDSLTHSVRFLAMMTKKLTIDFKDKNLKGKDAMPQSAGELMTFKFFNASSSKTRTLTVKETFLKMLLQLKGMSVEKALAITSMYNTPKRLMDSYKLCSQKEGEFLLSNLKHGEMAHNVGPSVSKAVYHLFAVKDLL